MNYGSGGFSFEFHQPVFKKVTSAGLNSLQLRGYQISVKSQIFGYSFHKKSWNIMSNFSTSSVRGQCYFLKTDWWNSNDRTSWTPIGSFYPSEPFTLDNFFMRHHVFSHSFMILFGSVLLWFCWYTMLLMYLCLYCTSFRSMHGYDL